MSKMFVSSEVPENAGILNGRFFLAIKVEGKDRELWKSGVIVKNNTDEMKISIVHYFVSVVRQQSIKMQVG